MYAYRILFVAIMAFVVELSFLLSVIDDISVFMLLVVLIGITYPLQLPGLLDFVGKRIGSTKMTLIWLTSFAISAGTAITSGIMWESRLYIVGVFILIETFGILFPVILYCGTKGCTD